MKKRLMLALMLILCAALLAGCSEEKRYNVKTEDGNQQTQQTQQNLGEQPGQPEEEIDPLAEEDDYTAGDDAAVEDDEWEAAELPEPPVVTPTAAPTVRSEYAGATPVVIDPIDKPTPTPVPPLTVTYVTYDATNIGLSFEGPAGWTKDASASDAFVLQNPNDRIDYRAQLELQATQVSSDYSVSDLESVINSMLDAIGSSMEFEEYDPSQTAERTLLGKNGVYANYSGTLADGRQVYGRVHAVCVDKVLYTVHLTAPRAQWDEYKEMVYDHLRDTLTITK